MSVARQANWVPTVAPGNRWIRENGYDVHVPPRGWPSPNERRLSCARRIEISKHPIVLSVSRSRVHHLFFPGHLSRRSSDSLGTTRSYDAAATTTTSELQRSRLFVDGQNRIADITVADVDRSTGQMEMFKVKAMIFMDVQKLVIRILIANKHLMVLWTSINREKCKK